MNKLIPYVGCAVIGAAIGVIAGRRSIKKDIPRLVEQATEECHKILNDLETRLNSVKTLYKMDRETYERKLDVLEAENKTLKRQLRQHRT